MNCLSTLGYSTAELDLELTTSHSNSEIFLLYTLPLTFNTLLPLHLTLGAPNHEHKDVPIHGLYDIIWTLGSGRENSTRKRI